MTTMEDYEGDGDDDDDDEKTSGSFCPHGISRVKFDNNLIVIKLYNLGRVKYTVQYAW